MAKHPIEFSRKAAKEYLHIPPHYKTLINAALNKLSEGGHLDIKPLKGEKNIYRIRVGVYRILYLKMETAHLIIRIVHRQSAYK